MINKMGASNFQVARQSAESRARADVARPIEWN
jgi:hypothetical protein